MSRVVFGLLFLAYFAGNVAAQSARNGRGYPPDLPGARAEVYKTIGEVKLHLYIFEPQAFADGAVAKERADGEIKPHPAIIFFFGGGWQSGTPSQFQYQCEHLARRGMVAITADYRVASRHGVKAVDCVRDAKSAVRWVRREAKRLGVDPERIAAGGGSAGGHLAAATGVIRGLDEPNEDSTISSVPNALVLFNPALVLAPRTAEEPQDAQKLASLVPRLGVPPRDLSPWHHVAKGAPPTIVFHGKEDTTVPYATAEAFAEAMKKAGNRCELVGYDGQSHGFFNHGRGGNEYFQKTTQAMDSFLVDLGYLPAAKAGEAIGR